MMHLLLFISLTEFDRDLPDSPGGVVADRNELGIQVGAEDREELTCKV